MGLEVTLMEKGEDTHPKGMGSQAWETLLGLQRPGSHQHSLATTHGDCGGPSLAAASPRITVQQ